MKVEPYHITGRVFGDYHGLSITEQPENAFGTIDRDYEHFLYPSNYGNSTSMSLAGGLSVNYNVLQQRMFVYVKFSYEAGMGRSTNRTKLLFQRQRADLPVGLLGASARGCRHSFVHGLRLLQSSGHVA